VRRIRPARKMPPFICCPAAKSAHRDFLVFSMFQHPAPFCLLDEVDAPLDDTNTERLCKLIKKMAMNTQFVFISHNKITMELAQQLVGVTMQERGVSKIVSVDIEEALRMNDNSAVHA
jgi:chromosome segregation protein